MALMFLVYALDAELGSHPQRVAAQVMRSELDRRDAEQEFRSRDCGTDPLYIESQTATAARRTYRAMVSGQHAPCPTCGARVRANVAHRGVRVDVARQGGCL